MKTRILNLFGRAALGFICIYVTWLGEAFGENSTAVSQRSFTSPAEAAQELTRAVVARDQFALCRILGPDFTNMLTGDRVPDERHWSTLASNLAARCVPVSDGSGPAMLEVGTEGWQFPIPLMQTNGSWVFDTTAGEESIVNQHIGRDEYFAIGACRLYVQAQQAYAREFADGKGQPIYAQRFKSTEGKTDGLYWPAESSKTPSPLSAFVAEACTRGYNWTPAKGPRPYHGYLFRILTRQGSSAPGGKKDYVQHGQMTGGFALVAYAIRW